MKLARYIGNGEVAIVDEPAPCLPEGGLLIKTEASGLCSGELMDWYMDRKIPHVLGHEVAGIVVESDDDRFPIGCRVFPHHHAPCWKCEMCRRGLHVHCAQWKSTKLIPGGMAEMFAVPRENLNDTIRVDAMRPRDAALIEPLACVAKAIQRAAHPKDVFTDKSPQRAAVIGLGVMGLMHMLLFPNAVGYEINPKRIQWAKDLGMEARMPSESQEADMVIICPGNQAAMDLAAQIVAPGGCIVLFAPTVHGALTTLDLNSLYFRDVRIVTSYSCGTNDTALAGELLRQGTIKAEQVVSDFISIDQLPKAYQAMKKGEILKAMVIFE
jgi:L-iditol 2-dehydrogenase